MGVAVQSHWFSVGSVVPWGEPGVGVVATQAFVDASYGPKGLSLMRRGIGPGAALRQLLRADKRSDIRQVAMVDAKGRVAVHTGSKCLPHAGCLKGRGFTVQANLMSSDGVWPAMDSSFKRSKGPLTERLLLALEAAERAGGDIRGRQSAAILVVSTSRPRDKWMGRLVDLRVEDNPRPLKELRRLVRLGKAYDHANRGDDLVSENRFSEAMKEYAMAARTAPEIEELKFWQGVTLLDKGRRKEALPLLIGAFRVRKQWKEVFAALPSYGLLHVEERVVKSILARN
jgi:uncharacterized Ntn-hydrolase superfamily protein